MPIDAESITSDVTLELDDPSISMTDFATAVDHFLGLIKEVAKVVAPSKDPTSWYVDVYPGSVGLGLRGKSGVYSSEELNVIRTSVREGLRDLERGKRSAVFSDLAIQHSKSLGVLVNNKAEPLSVRIWTGHQQTPLTNDVATKAESMLAPAYEEDGSVEGVLERVNVHEKRELVVYDTATRRGILCHVDENLIREALPYFEKRVEVVGKVRYRKDGQPVNVRATKIIPFPAPEEIPSLEQMRELLRGA